MAGRQVHRAQAGQEEAVATPAFLEDIPNDPFVAEDEEPEGTQEELAQGFFDAVKGMLE